MKFKGSHFWASFCTFLYEGFFVFWNVDGWVAKDLEGEVEKVDLRGFVKLWIPVLILHNYQLILTLNSQTFFCHFQIRYLDKNTLWVYKWTIFIVKFSKEFLLKGHLHGWVRFRRSSIGHHEVLYWLVTVGVQEIEKFVRCAYLKRISHKLYRYRAANLFTAEPATHRKFQLFLIDHYVKTVI